MELGFTIVEGEDSKYKIESLRYAVFYNMYKFFSSQDGIFEGNSPLLSKGKHMMIIRLFLFQFSFFPFLLSSVLTKDEKCLITVHYYHMGIILWSEVD